METDSPPAMAPCFNISHVIDEHSPLHGKSLQDMQARLGLSCWALYCNLRCCFETAQTCHDAAATSSRPDPPSAQQPSVVQQP